MFGADNDWMFASPLKIGRQPYSYTGAWRELQRVLRLLASASWERIPSGTRTAVGWMP